MNPITLAKNLKKISEKEIEMGTSGTSASWHNMYKDSAWIFIGGLDYDLTEGDIITVFSQYGEVVNINLVRDKESGKSKGFAFLCYEDQRSTILAVDNLNTIKLAGKIIRVDHVEQYKVPKQKDGMDDATIKLYNEGCAPQPVMLNPAKVKVEEVKNQEDTGRHRRRYEHRERESKRSSHKKSKKEKRSRSKERFKSSSKRRHDKESRSRRRD
jgi:RNA-binding motif X-linked protein 2